jgi:hypothetical protein
VFRGFGGSPIIEVEKSPLQEIGASLIEINPKKKHTPLFYIFLPKS